MNREDFLKECIAYFGETKQQSVCVEEMAELTQQLCKFMIDHPNKSREKLVEEYVDVLIMLNQMKIIFSITDEEVENGKAFKLARLQKHIESRRTPLALDAAKSCANCNHASICVQDEPGCHLWSPRK